MSNDEIAKLISILQDELAKRSSNKAIVRVEDLMKLWDSEDERLWHYNGGWFKTITALDESKTNGYSLIGEFFGFGGNTRSPPTGAKNVQVGTLILDCSIGGSRKNQQKKYLLSKLTDSGLVQIEIATGGNWALYLRDSIKKELGL